jgi:hypothetical protein
MQPVIVIRLLLDSIVGGFAVNSGVEQNLTFDDTVEHTDELGRRGVSWQHGDGAGAGRGGERLPVAVVGEEDDAGRRGALGQQLGDTEPG